MRGRDGLVQQQGKTLVDFGGLMEHVKVTQTIDVAPTGKGGGSLLLVVSGLTELLVDLLRH